MIDLDEVRRLPVPARPARPRATAVGAVVAAAVLTVHVIAWNTTDMSFGALVEGWGGIADFLALLLHNVGVMGKLWAEALEDADPGPVQALRSAGAGRIQVAAHALLPTVTPQMTGLLLYRLDVNVRSSLVLGLVGAGGIGFLINQSIELFQFDEMLTHILVVLVLIVAVDRLSALVRQRLA